MGEHVRRRAICGGHGWIDGLHPTRPSLQRARGRRAERFSQRLSTGRPGVGAGLVPLTRWAAALIMATVRRTDLKRLIDKLPDGELESAHQALQALIDKAAGEPDTIFLFPDNGRGPATELPHVSRSGGTVVVRFDGAKPPPSLDEIQARLRAQESAGATAEREWQESETDNRGRSQQG